MRSDARAASVSAAYSSSSWSPLAYASRSAGVTANPGIGPGPTSSARSAEARAGSVDGRNTRMVAKILPQSGPPRWLADRVGRLAFPAVFLVGRGGAGRGERGHHGGNGVVDRHVLPEPDHGPAGQDQRRVVDPVTLEFLGQFRAPVPFVPPRLAAVLRASVPEASVDEYRDLARGERDVRPDAPAGVQVQPVVLAVAITEPVQGTAQRQFGLGVRPPVGPHVGR